MDHIDILIYAAIAAFLFYRLWGVLGQRDEDSFKGKHLPPSFGEDPETDEENVMVLEGRTRLSRSKELTQAGHAKASLAGVLDQMREKDPAFEERTFLEGAKKAFREIVTGFARGDLSKMGRFLGPAVRGPFERAIEARKEAGQRLESTIDRIAAADIVGARLEGDTAFLTVEFISYQTNRLTGPNEAGQPAPSTLRAEEIRDRWIFRRELTAQDPNWLLVETQS